ncbi:MAG TPA: SPOR domain-containing protein [Rubellimicrobium sp.]|nr:SPOR domain-containing protein [Rubellimicrobium sp.]
MADWTANSNFGAFGRREPVVRAVREHEPPRTEVPRAERFAAQRPEEIEVPRSASAALADYNAAQDSPLAKARLAVWVGGGVVSLALIAVTGVWGYKLVLREVMGLPVVVAEPGPMRLAPADPEGEVVPQQGLAVNAIPAAGTAAPPSDVLMLAPQTTGLAEEDLEVVQTTAEADEVMPVASAAAEAPAAAPAPAAVVTGALPPAGAAPAEVAAAVVPTTPTEAAPVRLTSALLPSDRPMTTDEVLAFADQIAGQSAPLADLAAPVQAAVAAIEAVAAPVESAAPAEAAPAETPEAAPVVALVAAPAVRPQARPAAKAAPAVAEATPAEESATSSEATPVAEASSVALTASLPTGTNLIQLGAFDSAEIAASEWSRLQGAFGEFLGSKDRVIQETQSGGRTLFRLRATGFADRADARRLCAALTAEGADCIPVTVD